MKNKSIIVIVLGTAFILLIPLIAMRFTDEVNWSLTDFVIIGSLLLGTGLVYELVARKITRTSHRVILGVVLLFAMLLLWADLAVGIFGIPGFSGS